LDDRLRKHTEKRQEQAVEEAQVRLERVMVVGLSEMWSRGWAAAAGACMAAVMAVSVMGAVVMGVV
jgi:hypothetical protein